MVAAVFALVHQLSENNSVYPSKFFGVVGLYSGYALVFGCIARSER